MRQIARNPPEWQQLVSSLQSQDDQNPSPTGTCTRHHFSQAKPSHAQPNTHAQICSQMTLVAAQGHCQNTDLVHATNWLQGWGKAQVSLKLPYPATEGDRRPKVVFLLGSYPTECHSQTKRAFWPESHTSCLSTMASSTLAWVPPSRHRPTTHP